MSRKPKKMTLDEIKKMEAVCRLAAEALQMAGKMVKPGVTSQEINDAVHEFTLSKGCLSAPLNYHGFPKSICTSINDVVCHGVPKEGEVLNNGDIINVDVTLIKEGFFGDTSRTFFVGDVSDEAKRITQAAQESMYAGIDQVKAKARTHDIGAASEKVAKSYGYFPVRDIGGHGIGKAFHLDPFVPAMGPKGTGPRIMENTCLTVEPMINATSHRYETFQIPNSNITYFRTLDGSLSAQFEHTILVTSDGRHVLTEW
ncbi:type I methionyl aminopeptidase [Lentisphaera profundi]|uniref:Methionine aminopeptidase n=1 Tax=Lentisphaera profundi TaxID=1658616 RepID=A0ABY7VUU7_9BACT|nr:type I methionyl aminopeptidase [Lentisphaera profundi]WDE97058.1 type I methionyl aminopeptidase [Lentisphaera profundi]